MTKRCGGAASVLVAAALALAWITASAQAREFVTYSRNGTLTNGTFVHNWDCPPSGLCGNVYRGGSGSGTNACQTNNWIPTGTYGIPWHNHAYNASLIKGRVWRVTDYHCANGVVRTELFIHSEETQFHGQSCGAGDQPFCWEGAGDYYSNGCIKIARTPGSATTSDLGLFDARDHAVEDAIDWLTVNG